MTNDQWLFRSVLIPVYLNKHCIVAEVEVSRVLNDANSLPTASRFVEDFCIFSAGANAADTGEFHFVLAGIPGKLDAINLGIHTTCCRMPILDYCIAIARFLI